MKRSLRIGTLFYSSVGLHRDTVGRWGHAVLAIRWVVVKLMLSPSGDEPRRFFWVYLMLQYREHKGVWLRIGPITFTVQYDRTWPAYVADRRLGG